MPLPFIGHTVAVVADLISLGELSDGIGAYPAAMADGGGFESDEDEEEFRFQQQNTHNTKIITIVTTNAENIKINDVFGISSLKPSLDLRVVSIIPMGVVGRTAKSCCSVVVYIVECEDKYESKNVI
jgi:hypothetical protein